MYLFFDTETTGIPRRYNAPVSDLDNWPRLVQLAFLLTDPVGIPIASREFLIQPDGFAIPPDAARVHGITTAHARAHGMPLRTALDAFLAALPSAQTLVAHNMAFDENILGAEFLRAHLPNPLPAARRFCTMQSTTNFCQLPGRYGKFKWPSLAELHHKLFAKDFQGAHGALPDVQACATCFFELRRRNLIPA